MTIKNMTEVDLSMDSLTARSHREFCLAVSEEFGYRAHIWFPPFAESELESKWQSTPAAGMKGLFSALGGEWIVLVDSDINTSKEVEAHEVYERIDVPGRYRAHICCDQDSHLITPDGRVLAHNGFDWDESAGSDLDPRILQNSLKKTPQGD